MRLPGAFLFLPTNLPAIEIGVQIDPFQLDPDNSEPSSIGNQPSIGDLVCNQAVSQSIDNFLTCCPDHSGNDGEVRAL